MGGVYLPALHPLLGSNFDFIGTEAAEVLGRLLPSDEWVYTVT